MPRSKFNRNFSPGKTKSDRIKFISRSLNDATEKQKKKKILVENRGQQKPTLARERPKIHFFNLENYNLSSLSIASGIEHEFCYQILKTFTNYQANQ